MARNGLVIISLLLYIALKRILRGEVVEEQSKLCDCPYWVYICRYEEDHTRRDSKIRILMFVYVKMSELGATFTA